MNIRPRRLRKTDNIRDLVRENRLYVSDFIAPVFVTSNNYKSIDSMPNVFQWPIKEIGRELDELLELGITKILLFGIPSSKDESGSDTYSNNGIIQLALNEIKSKYSELFIITDVCLCEYTDHGHCGIIKDGDVDNDLTLEILSKQAISHVENGSDMLAPSGMMDSMVASMRKSLDSEGYINIPIMSYSVKYASSFYGPFREAANCSPKFGNRQTYQMDPANVREAIKEAMLDIDEGADIVIVKPAISYLDVIAKIKEVVNVPIAAYNVSGEYSMIKAAAEKGWLEHDASMMEMLLSIKRAGADIIISYFAKEAAKFINHK